MFSSSQTTFFGAAAILPQHEPALCLLLAPTFCWPLCLVLHRMQHFYPHPAVGSYGLLSLTHYCWFSCLLLPFLLLRSCATQVALGTAPNCLSQRFASRAGDIFGWQNGPNSRCFPVTWPFETARYRFPGSLSADDATIQDSRCYETSCTPTGQLQLSIWGNKVDCPSGQTVDLATALPGVFDRGLIGPCPDNKAACGSLACGEGCSGDGVCVAGKCYCGLMYTGPGCRTRVTAAGAMLASNSSSIGSSSSNTSSAYVPPPDSSIRVLGGGVPGDTGDTSDTASNRSVTRSASDRSVTAEDGRIISEAAPAAAGYAAADSGDISDGTTIKVRRGQLCCGSASVAVLFCFCAVNTSLGCCGGIAMCAASSCKPCSQVPAA
jgi:hypothetical protein